MAREQITFQCTDCKRKNYTSMKNKKTTTERLEMRKFCPFCVRFAVHVVILGRIFFVALPVSRLAGGS